MKKLLLLLLLFPLTGKAQSAQRWYTALLPNPSGQDYVSVIPNASVYVCPYNVEIQCNGSQPIYADTALNQPIVQPLIADGNGVYSYYIQSGTQVVEKVCAPYNQCSSYIVQVGDNVSEVPGSGTVTSVSCGPLNPIFGCSVATSTTTPTISFSLDNSQSFSFLGNFQNTSAGPQYYTLVAGTNITLGVNNGSTPPTLTISASGGGGGTGGCSTGGIPTTNGTVNGDNTSTNCGYQNRVSDTATDPAKVSTFGYQLLTSNSAQSIVAIGNQVGTHNAATELINIGDTNGTYATGTNAIVMGQNNMLGAAGETCELADAIVIGDGNTRTCLGNVTFDSVLIGADNGPDTVSANTIQLQHAVGVGSDNFIEADPSSTLTYNVSVGFQNLTNLGGGSFGASQNVAIGEFNMNAAVAISGGYSYSNTIGIGNSNCEAMTTLSEEDICIGDSTLSLGPDEISIPVAPTNYAIGIGSQAGQASYGTDVVAIGDQDLGELTAATVIYENSGHDIVAIGNHSAWANTTGTDNVEIGDYAGCVGCVEDTAGPNGHIGFGNQTGSHNVWIGDNAGPGVTTQLSNTIAIGNQAQANASNQTVIGNSSVTSLKLFGCPSGQVVYDDGSGTCVVPGGSGGSATVASAEVVSFSATPTFSTSFNVSRIVLTGNITSFTLGSGGDGQSKTLCFKQGSGPYTVAAPSNVHGFFTIGTINADWNCQSYVYDSTDSIWQAVSLGVINE